MIEVINLSVKGQLVIPRDVREAMGLNPNDKMILVTDEDTILLKKIKEEDVKVRMKALIKTFTKEFARAGITKEDIKREAKNIMDSFSRKLASVKEKISESKVEREEFERVENEGNECDDDFRKRMFENTPNKNTDFILAEKKSWE